MEEKEIEARFLEIDKKKLVGQLRALGATDRGETLLQEIIFYDPTRKWLDDRKFVRLRKNGEKVTLTYKHHKEMKVDGATEIEFTVSDMDKAEAFLEHIGVSAYRHQEKKRHTFQLRKVTVDIDTWPKIPTYVELEGPSEQLLKDAAKKLGFDWSRAVFDDARSIIENRYHIPVGKMRWFSFKRCK